MGISDDLWQDLLKFLAEDINIKLVISFLYGYPIILLASTSSPTPAFGFFEKAFHSVIVGFIPGMVVLELTEKFFAIIKPIGVKLGIEEENTDVREAAITNTILLAFFICLFVVGQIYFTG